MNITHNTAGHRIETKAEGFTAYVDYTITDGTLSILHTKVPTELKGRGIAAELVKYAYDYAQSQGLRPQAVCSYAAAWLEKHPDYRPNNTPPHCAVPDKK